MYWTTSTLYNLLEDKHYPDKTSHVLRESLKHLSMHEAIFNVAGLALDLALDPSLEV